MIVFRGLNNVELLNMINNTNVQGNHQKGKNTFKYDDTPYKHFFLFSDHVKFYLNNNLVIGEYVIPDNIIQQKGFGFYSMVKTMRNMKLYGYKIPLPEIIIKEEDFKKEYLYNLSNDNDESFVIKKLNNNDNEKFNEKEEYYFGDIDNPYSRYSYAEVYYELLCKLAKKNKWDMNKVTSILQKIDLVKEIENYYISNKDILIQNKKEYLKRKN